MSRIITASWIVMFLWATNLFSQNNKLYERYAKLSVRNFNVQNFDSCIHYNYILAHKYSLDGDSANLANTWNFIAIINLLQEKYSRAQAARIIAHRFGFHNKKLDYVYKSILEYKNNRIIPQGISIHEISEGLSAIPFSKLIYIQPLLKAKNDFRNGQFSEIVITLQRLLSDMKAKGSTDWFGYAEACLLLGDCFYFVDDHIHSISYYEASIRISEKNQMYNITWINSYGGMLNALWFTGQSEKRDSCFQRIEKEGVINNNRAAYYSVK
jgi:hypothetical protein